MSAFLFNKLQPPSDAVLSDDLGAGPAESFFRMRQDMEFNCINNAFDIDPQKI